MSSNILFEVKGMGSEEAGMIKSIGSIFENSIIADSVLSHAFNLSPYLEPAGNMMFSRNIFANITSPPYGASDDLTATDDVTTSNGSDPRPVPPMVSGYTKLDQHLNTRSGDQIPSLETACINEKNITECATEAGKRCDAHPECLSFAYTAPPPGGYPVPEFYKTRNTNLGPNPGWTYYYKGPPIPTPAGQPTPPPAPHHAGIDYSIGGFTTATISASGKLMQNPKTAAAYGFTPSTTPASTDPVIKEWDNNTFFGVDGHDLAQVASHGWDLHASDADPLLVRSSGTDAWHHDCADYALHPNSPTIPMGFRPMDMSQGFGPRNGAFSNDPGLTVDAVRRKVQAERYQRMHGLWREGSLGIGTDGKANTKYAFAPDAWAKFDSVDIDCPAPCQLQVRAATQSARGTSIKVAVGSPDDAHTIAQLQVNATTIDWTVLVGEVTAPGGAISAKGASIFLRINGTCRVDWFRFVTGSK
jgi:hypothetical protein